MISTLDKVATIKLYCNTCNCIAINLVGIYAIETFFTILKRPAKMFRKPCIILHQHIIDIWGNKVLILLVPDNKMIDGHLICENIMAIKYGTDFILVWHKTLFWASCDCRCARGVFVTFIARAWASTRTFSFAWCASTRFARSDEWIIVIWLCGFAHISLHLFFGIFKIFLRTKLIE